MLKEKMFKGSVDINYAEGPDNGHPLLLLHGTMNRWQAFLRHISEFASRWHVYAKDFRGHGRSGRCEHYGYDFFYHDTIQFIEENIKKPTVVFGHSLGGRVALKLSSERPELVKAIILGDSSLNDPVASTRMGEFFGRMLPLLEADNSVNGLYKALKQRAGEQFDPVKTMIRVKSLSQVDPGFIRCLVKYGGDLESPYGHFTGYKPSEHLKKVECPVLLLQAENGMLIDEQVENALGVLPEAYAVKLMDVPHEFLTEDIAPVVDAVNAFLELIL